MKISVPQKRTFATKMAKPSLAPHAENVMKINIKQGLRDSVAQENINIIVRAERVAASRINNSVRIEGCKSRKYVIIIINIDRIMEDRE